MNRTKKTFFLIILGIVLILIGVSIFINKKETVQVISSPIPSQSLLPVSTPSGQITYAKVTRVIDGDTIVISAQGGSASGGDAEQKVRYIGMNTPEMETSECFATEASEINKNLVLGKEVELVKDVSETDKYGRLLRFVYVGNIFVDDYLIKFGYAKIMTVPPDVEYESQFLESENYAKENGLGLWSKCF
jgi:micrococcal nuclease